jgi:hypothetical protein
MTPASLRLVHAIALIVLLAFVACGDERGQKITTSCDTDETCGGGVCYESRCYSTCTALERCDLDEICVRETREGGEVEICVVPAEFEGCAEDADCAALIPGACERATCDAGVGLCGFVALEDGHACDAASGEAGACAAGVCEEGEPPTHGQVVLDALFVIDNSSSMCQEQAALHAGFDALLTQLEGLPTLDLRIAVTTTDVRSEGFKGGFRNTPATVFPPGCQEAVLHECVADGDCAYLEATLGGGWTCDAASTPARTLNDNGSVNSACHKGCEEDQACVDAFGAGYECQANPGKTGCIPVPDTASCPEILPLVLDHTQLDLFGCLSLVGVAQTPNVNLEGGLKAAIRALERGDAPCALGNPNLCQLWSAAELAARLEDGPGEASEACWARLEACDADPGEGEPAFGRPAAHLLIVFLSDEEDCSDRDEDPFSLDESVTCAFKPEKLLPLDEIEASLRALKHDPARLLVASIVGDAVQGGSRSCLIPDDCLAARQLDACACYQPDGDKSGCPELLQGDDHGALCAGGGEGDEAAAEELAYRTACVDACLGKDDEQKCSGALPEVCGCYAPGAVTSPACQEALADEPTYRLACQRACFEAAKEQSAMLPGAAPYVCSSPYGRADLGSRYLALASRFGDDGFAGSLCAPGGLAAVLDELGARIITRLAP